MAILMATSTLTAIIGVLGVWLFILTVLVVRYLWHYNRLTKGVTSSGLRDILESLLREKRDVARHLLGIDETIKSLSKDGTFHLQRIGIVRFNPFSDTGGAQSFTIALLDGAGNGVVMTSLYARAGNRWYVKQVRGTKGGEIALSKEEEAAIRKATFIKGAQ